MPIVRRLSAIILVFLALSMQTVLAATHTFYPNYAPVSKANVGLWYNGDCWCNVNSYAYVNVNGTIQLYSEIGLVVATHEDANTWATESTPQIQIPDPPNDGGSRCITRYICIMTQPTTATTTGGYIIYTAISLTVTWQVEVYGEFVANPTDLNSGYLLEANTTIYDVSQGMDTSFPFYTTLASGSLGAGQHLQIKQTYSVSISTQVNQYDYYEIYAGIHIQVWIGGSLADVAGYFCPKVAGYTCGQGDSSTYGIKLDWIAVSF